jgi:hypothetical protein
MVSYDHTMNTVCAACAGLNCCESIDRDNDARYSGIQLGNRACLVIRNNNGLGAP